MIKVIHELFDEKLLKFIGVGIVNTIVGMLIMFGLYNLAGCSYWLSSASNYVLTSILSYILNKKYTFKYGGDVKGSALRFSINIAACYILAYGIAKPATYYLLNGQTQKLRDNVAMAVGMVFFTGFNYLGQRFFAFRKKDNAANED